jgi:uncharacterized RDD family membrane protein YckC
VVLSSSGRRLGGFLLGGLLRLVTALIGYVIWALIVFKRGQDPEKQLLHMRAVKLSTAARATWGTMLLRDGSKLVIVVVSAFALYIPLLWLIWDRKRQQPWDKIAGTIVVDDHHDALR